MSDYYIEKSKELDSKKASDMTNNDIYEWAIGRAAMKPDWAKKYLAKNKAKDKDRSKTPTVAKKASPNAVGYSDSRTSRLDPLTVWHREDDLKVSSQKIRTKAADQTIDLTPGV